MHGNKILNKNNKIFAHRDQLCADVLNVLHEYKLDLVVLGV